MARLPLSVAFLSCALPIACSPTPEREYGPLAGSSSDAFEDDFEDEDDPDESDDAAAETTGPDEGDNDDGVDDGEPADDGDPPGPALSSALPQPRMHCSASACMEGGLGAIEKLEGRDVVREAFFSVAGFPDGHTYATHAHADTSAPPQQGVMGQVSAGVRMLTTLVAESGIASCDDLPVSGQTELASAPGVVISFAPGETAPPPGFKGAGVAFEKRVQMTDASGATAVVETTCNRNAAFASLSLLEAPGVYSRIDVAWDTTEQDAHQVELMAYSKLRDERVAIRFTTDELEYGLWLVRVRASESPDRYVGLRAFVHGDSVDQTASVYLQQLGDDAPYLEQADGADSAGLAPVAGSTLHCVDFLAEDPLQGVDQTCPGLELVATTAPGFDADGAFSIAWAAAPFGQGGLLDAL